MSLRVPLRSASLASSHSDILAALGARNALAARPDLSVCSWCGAKKLRPEVIEARGLGVPVVCVPESGLGRPGPRLLEGARGVASALARL